MIAFSHLPRRGAGVLAETYLARDLKSETWVLHPSGLALLEATLPGQEDCRLLLESPLGLMKVRGKEKEHTTGKSAIYNTGEKCK